MSRPEQVRSFGPRAIERRSGAKRKRGGLRRVLLVVAGVAALSGAIGARAAIVAKAPAAGVFFSLIGLPVNAIGIELANVRSTIMEADAKKIMVVEGSIVNLRDRDTPQPDMRVSLNGADGRELYHWTVRAGKAKLSPYEHLSFRTRLAAPPDGVRDVLVKFVEAGDKLALNEGGS